MAGKGEKPEDFVTKLRQVEVLSGQGMSMADTVRQIGVSQHTFYRCRRRRDHLRRARITLGERLLRELQRQVQR